jgi:hypothetical protein
MHERLGYDSVLVGYGPDSPTRYNSRPDLAIWTVVGRNWGATLNALVGSPATIAQALLEYVRLGVTGFRIHVRFRRPQAHTPRPSRRRRPPERQLQTQPVVRDAITPAVAHGWGSDQALTRCREGQRPLAVGHSSNR